ncbi:unnamed protein product [Ambrosiozyma monospora]|uniref:Unnamed protein product n=1 Tax=Ambrosiozyma monospora TaxID=43982 RepID=A0ACB5TR04_AMBMO|nr:unnamed protein product [Ambrosiozyma monospora]
MSNQPSTAEQSSSSRREETPSILTSVSQTQATNSNDTLQASTDDQHQQQEQAQQQQQELPEFNLTNVLSDIKQGLWSLFNDPNVSNAIIVLLLFLESILLKIIIARVPYTEIDYSTYMQQISQIEAGELDYSKIGGDTGPIVYPGGYVFIYSWMKWITDGMDDLEMGQVVFRWLYLVNLAIVGLCYLLAGGDGAGYGMKPVFLYLLCISKRLHSIYVLRLFNDCWCTLFAVSAIAILLFAVFVKQRGFGLANYVLCFIASDLLSVAVSIKMNALLYVPGFCVVFWHELAIFRSW